MRITIGIAIVIISILIFGWWGLFSLIFALPFIGWKDRFKGPLPIRKRWSIRFSFNGEVMYELTHERAEVLVGCVMLSFFQKKKLNEGWEIFLIFNKRNSKFRLSEKYFPNDQKPAKELYTFLEFIDQNHSKLGKSSDDPIFFSTKPYQNIPLSSFSSLEEVLKNPDNAFHDRSFYSVLNEIFVK